MSDAKVVALGPFEKRAARTISNAMLYDLVQDMARVVDVLPGRLAEQDKKLDAILEKLDARGNS
jgi:hypothetical protein